jgi:sulfur transfer protein SufE
MDTLNETRSEANFDEILSDFELLDDWEDRYRYVIELGRRLQPLAEEDRTAANKVRGCVSQVWLATLELCRRQRRPYRSRADRDPLFDLFGQDRRRDREHRRSP